MEFARRRKRRRRQSNFAGRAVVVLLIIAAVVYFITASKAGTWIAENVMAPVFSALSTYSPFDTAPSESTDAEDVATGDAYAVSLSTDKSSMNVNIALPAVNCYALQMGVYSAYDNAYQQSASLQAQGAGGFILQDGDRYRVLAAGYNSEADAKEVKTRLISSGTDCALYTLTAPGATFKITAEPTQVEAIEQGFPALSNALTALGETAIAFDRDGMDVAAGKTAVQGICDTLKSDTAGLSAYTSYSSAIAQIITCRDTFTTSLQTLAEDGTESTTLFSAMLKNAHLMLAHEYCAMADGITS